MERTTLISYFDATASEWETLHPCEPNKLRCLVSLCVTKEARVLEVGCGTGVMLPYILEKEPSSVLGVDFSPEMIAIAQKKYSHERISFQCEDVMELNCLEPFDVAILHETFSYIDNRGSLMRQLHHLLAPHGRVMICNTQNRQTVNAAQPGEPSSLPLPAAKTLAANYAKYFDMDILIDTDEFYAVSGKKLFV